MNSPLVVHTNLSPNKTTKRTRAIDTITIHCTANQVTAEQLGQMFEKKEKKASGSAVRTAGSCWIRRNMFPMGIPFRTGFF
jgi:hypothetical protein